MRLHLFGRWSVGVCGDGGKQMASSRGHSCGSSRKLIKYDRTSCLFWHTLVMLGFQKLPFALVMDYRSTEITIVVDPSSPLDPCQMCTGDRD